MMKTNEAKAESVLNEFYSTILRQLEHSNSNDDLLIKFNAVVVSDCAVIFLSHHDNDLSIDVDQTEGLAVLLNIIRRLNQSFVNHNYRFMTTCSISYGEFHYRNRREIDHVSKNYLRGEAYLEAFKDHESNDPKIQPGECRVLKRKLQIDLDNSEVFSLLNRERKYYYFYWMLHDNRRIKNYKTRYKQTIDNMYENLIELIRDETNK